MEGGIGVDPAHDRHSGRSGPRSSDVMAHHTIKYISSDVVYICHIECRESRTDRRSDTHPLTGETVQEAVRPARAPLAQSGERLAGLARRLKTFPRVSWVVGRG